MNTRKATAIHKIATATYSTNIYATFYDTQCVPL